MSSPVNRLDLVEGERARPGSPGLAERARHDQRLAGPLEQLHMVVDGVSVLSRILALDFQPPYCFDGLELVSVADLAWPEHASSSLRQLVGRAARDPSWNTLERGRLPLYVCSECADLGCGALTVAVERGIDPESGRRLVHWAGLRCEDSCTAPEAEPDLSPVGPFAFDADQYDTTLLAAIHRMDELFREERRAADAWKEQRRLGVRLRRFLGR